MFFRLFFTLLITLPLSAEISPRQVAIVYNSNLPASFELAEFYALSRGIPASNLIGLNVTEKATIDRATYEKSIRQPLVKKFTENNWWKLGKDANGLTLPVARNIRCLVMMKGLPLRISRSPIPAGETKETRQLNEASEAAIDSELSLMGVSKYPIGGLIPNPYFQKDDSVQKTPEKFFILVGRIDAINYDQCKRMILDALDVEKEGLWGSTYLDFSLKKGGFANGEKWIENIAKKSRATGNLIITDRNSNTFVTNYPMRECAVYFGWYTFHRNGPFLNDQMSFKKGAIACHIHSLSGAQLLNPKQNWSAALIDRGAAATIGNTFEPYLQATHHLDTFYDRLLKGYTLVEASYMSINAFSWQNFVIGDPLYRPYLKKNIDPKDFKTDRDYKILRYAQSQFPDETRTSELIKAAERTKSGIVYEALALQSLEDKKYEEALKLITKAKALYKDPADKLRQDLHLVEFARRQGKTAAAISILRKIKPTYQNIPESKAIDGLLVILDPPAPPATKK